MTQHGSFVCLKLYLRSFTPIEHHKRRSGSGEREETKGIISFLFFSSLFFYFFFFSLFSSLLFSSLLFSSFPSFPCMLLQPPFLFVHCSKCPLLQRLNGNVTRKETIHAAVCILKYRIEHAGPGFPFHNASSTGSRL